MLIYNTRKSKLQYRALKCTTRLFKEEHNKNHTETDLVIQAVEMAMGFQF